MTYRPVDTSLHTDAKFLALSGPSAPNAQDLFAYHLTSGNDVSIPGLHAVGYGKLLDRFRGWSLKGIKAACNEIEGAGMARADWAVGVLWLPNALSFTQNQPRAISNLKHWGKHWHSIPECTLKHEAWLAARAWVSSKGDAWLEAFLLFCPEPELVATGPTAGAKLAAKRVAKLAAKLGARHVSESDSEATETRAKLAKTSVVEASKTRATDPDPDPDLPLGPPPGGAPENSPDLADRIRSALASGRPARGRARDPVVDALWLGRAAEASDQTPGLGPLLLTLAALRECFSRDRWRLSEATAYVRALAPERTDDLREAIGICLRREHMPPLAVLQSAIAEARHRRERLEVVDRLVAPVSAQDTPAGPDTADPRWLEIQRQCRAEGVPLVGLHAEVLRRLSAPEGVA